MPTLKDIAKIAGVSVSTVSKAINDSSEINRDTKTKIIRIAHDLNYRIDTASSETSRTRSGSIGVICPEVKSNYYAQLISSIDIEITKYGYHFATSISDFKPSLEEYFLEFYGTLGVDGIILITENPDIQQIIKGIKDIWNIPIVLITNENNLNEYDCISIDDHQGVITGVESLIRLGHKQIGYIGDNLTDSRLDDFKSTLQSYRLPIIDPFIRIYDTRFEECGYQGMNAILNTGRYPTALFTAYDDIAIGAIRAITERNLSVPEDISIVGMDDVSICPYLYRGLTTISSPIKEMAAVSLSILMKKVMDKNFTVVQNVTLKPSLIVRETTAKLET